MKPLFVVIIGLIIFSCSSKLDRIGDQKEEPFITGDSSSLEIPSRIEHVNEPYFVGDINNDNILDTAYVNYDRKINYDSAIEKECINNDCEVTIKFSSNIPPLIITQSLGITIQKSFDLNNDKANEIILFSQWFEGFWGYIYVYSLKNFKWIELGKTKAFLSNDKDWQNRIVKSNNRYYLLGDGWDDSKGGVTDRSERMEIEQ